MATLFHTLSIPYLAGYVKYNNPMDEAVLYILYSPIHKAVKVGISDISGRRFASHRTKGWILIKYWHFFERDKARRVEYIVLKTLRERYGYFLDKADMPQNGYTETFDASKISRRALIRMVNKAIKDT
jgi:hypothetical protein